MSDTLAEKPQLPTELIHQIICSIPPTPSNRKTLLQCTHVSRAFYPIARERFWSTLDVTLFGFLRTNPERRLQLLLNAVLETCQPPSQNGTNGTSSDGDHGVFDDMHLPPLISLIRTLAVNLDLFHSFHEAPIVLSRDAPQTSGLPKEKTTGDSESRFLPLLVKLLNAISGVTTSRVPSPSVSSFANSSRASASICPFRPKTNITSFKLYAYRGRLFWDNVPPTLRQALYDVSQLPTIKYVELRRIRAVPASMVIGPTKLGWFGFGGGGNEEGEVEREPESRTEMRRASLRKVSVYVDTHDGRLPAGQVAAPESVQAGGAAHGEEEDSDNDETDDEEEQRDDEEMATHDLEPTFNVDSAVVVAQNRREGGERDSTPPMSVNPSCTPPHPPLVSPPLFHLPTPPPLDLLPGSTTPLAATDIRPTRSQAQAQSQAEAHTQTPAQAQQQQPEQTKRTQLDLLGSMGVVIGGSPEYVTARIVGLSMENLTREWMQRTRTRGSDGVSSRAEVAPAPIARAASSPRGSHGSVGNGEQLGTGDGREGLGRRRRIPNVLVFRPTFEVHSMEEVS